MKSPVNNVNLFICHSPCRKLFYLNLFKNFLKCFYFAVSLLSLGFSAADTWLTPSLSFLIREDFKFPISEDQISLIASLYNVGEIIGFLTYPLTIDRFGRKYTILFYAAPQILACILIFIAKNVITLYLARIINGICNGAVAVVLVIYLNEIAKKEYRGLVMSISWVASSLGTICGILLGAFVSYDTMNLVILILQPAFIVPFFQVPESPYFYLKLDRENEAIECLSKLRKNNDPQSIILEIKSMKENIKDDEENSKFTLRNIFENKRYRKAFLIIITIKLGVLFSGNSVIAVYIQEIFMYTGFSLPPEYSMVIAGTISTLFVVPILYLADTCGRRYVIAFASIATFISLFYLGLFFFLKHYLQIQNLSSISWTPLLAVIIFLVSSDALFNVSAILSGEVFSSQVKSPALSFLYIKSKIVEVLLKLSFATTIRLFDIYGVVWTYAVVFFLLCMITLKFLPETKGKSLEEIQFLLD